MSKLKNGLNFCLRLVRNKTFVASFGAVLILVGGSITLSVKEARYRDRQQAAELSRLSEQQKQRQKDFPNSASEGTAHIDVSDLQFKDISEGTFNKPSCVRLENRKAIIITSSSCDYRLRAFGEVTMAVVFVNEGFYYQSEYENLKNGNKDDVKSLEYLNTYLDEQATRFLVSDKPRIKMTYYGPFEVSKSIDKLYYRDNGGKYLEALSQTSRDNNVPEEDYDLVHYVFLEPAYGGMAFPGLHRAFTVSGYLIVPTFVHETLHLFGASDKYNNNDCNTIGTNDPFGRYNGTLPGRDIMCSNFDIRDSKINDITAREIGWGN